VTGKEFREVFFFFWRQFFSPSPPLLLAMSRPHCKTPVKHEVLVKEEEAQEESDDDKGGTVSEEAAVAGDDLVRVYETERYLPPSSRPVSG